MSIGSNSGVSFSGLASGIDTDSIVQRLIEIERSAVTRVRSRQNVVLQKKETFSALSSQLSSFSSALSGLNASTSFSSAKVTLSSSDYFNVTSTSSASPANLEVKVNKLATAHKMTTSSLSNTDALGLAGTFSINGKSITIADTEKLADVAAKINGAKAGVTASIINNGSGQAVLTVTASETGTSKAISFTEGSGEVLVALGLQTKSTVDGVTTYSLNTANQVTAAQNAEIVVDRVTITSEKNSITDAIPGLTFNLTKADPATTVTMAVAQTFDTGKSGAKSFVDAFNSLNAFLKENASFDKETFLTAPLFGDPIVSQIESEIYGIVNSPVSGLSGTYTTLSSVGITFGDDGALKLDDARFEAALAADPDAVKRLFQASGSSATSSLKYISSNDKTVASGSAPYNVNITQVATKNTLLREINADALASEGLTLKFENGGISGEASLSFIPGTSLEQIVSTINKDDRLKEHLVASVEGGRLKLEATRYGTSANFTVDVSTDSAFELLGRDPDHTTNVGVDVAGTINGEAATGSGQFLTGNTGNAKTEGLQIQYTGSTIGSIGSMTFSRGVANALTQRIAGYSSGANSLLTANSTTLQSQIDDYDAQMTEMEARLTTREALLRQQFQAMEAAIQSAQAQGNQLASILASQSAG